MGCYGAWGGVVRVEKIIEVFRVIVNNWPCRIILQHLGAQQIITGSSGKIQAAMASRHVPLLDSGIIGTLPPSALQIRRWPLVRSLNLLVANSHTQAAKEPTKIKFYFWAS